MSKSTITGFAGLEENLKKLHKAHAKNVMRKALREASKPVVEKASSYAPVETGTLSESMKVGPKLNQTQARLQRRAEGRHTVEMFIGPTSPRGVLLEFGTEHTAPDPFLAPAWDSSKDEVLADIKRRLWENTKNSLTKRGIAFEGPEGDE